MEEKKNNSSKLIIGLLLVVVAVLAYLLTQSKGDTVDLETEKERILFNLNDSRTKLQEMESTNDSLDNFIVEETSRITALIDSVNNISEASAAEIKKLKNRVWSYKQKEKKLIAEIEKLNARYDTLLAEKTLVDMSLMEESQKNEVLAVQNRMLEKEVAIGSMLQAPIVKSMAVKVYNSGKERVTGRARRADRLKTCATISKNTLAPAGTRMVYMRVTTPDNTVLNGGSGEETSFDFNGQPLMYTNKIEVDYQKEAMEICLDFDKEDWSDGKYIVELYTEGYGLGRAEVELK